MPGRVKRGCSATLPACDGRRDPKREGVAAGPRAPRTFHQTEDLVKPENGMRVLHVLTGIAGVVVCKTFWMNGCVRVTIQPMSTDGKAPDTITHDEAEFEVLDSEPIKLPAHAPTGGGRRDPIGLPNPK